MSRELAAAAALVDAFLRLDAKLVAAGFPPTSPWWRDVLERFLCSGRRTLVARVGRRGGKSSTVCRLAVALAIGVDWPIPPGDTGFIVIVSARMEDAYSRLTTIEAILRALKVPFTRRDNTIHLDGQPIAFRAIPATVAAASGPTTVAIIADEVAKWRNDVGANPAAEVLASLRPTMATMAKHGARMALISSPFGLLDAHAEAFDRGDTDDQIVAHAPTWIANPTLTEEETRALEPNARVWSREYAAVPSATASAAFETEDVLGCFRAPPPGVMHGEPILVLDPSSGRGDHFTGAVACWAWPLKQGAKISWSFVDERRGETWPHHLDPWVNPREAFAHYPPGGWFRHRPKAEDIEEGAPPFVLVSQVDGIEGRFEASTAVGVWDHFAKIAKRNGVRHVYGDQREMLAGHAALARHSLRYEVCTWSNESKRIAIEIIRRWMQTRALVLPDHEKLRRQLLEYETKITPSGYEVSGGRGRNDDYAALLLTLAMVESNGGLHCSPDARPVPRGVVTSWAV